MVAETPKDSPRDAPKGGTPPVILKKARPGGDDDGEKEPMGGGQLKQKMLSTGLSRAIVLATLIASLAVLLGGLFGDRYSLIPAPNSTNSYMYRIDRLTGGVQFCGPQQCSDVPARAADK